MSEASEAYIDELRAEKKQLNQLLQMFQAIIQTRQQIDQVEGRDVPSLPFGVGTISMEDIGNHINALGGYLAQKQTPPAHSNGNEPAEAAALAPAPSAGRGDS